MQLYAATSTMELKAISTWLTHAVMLPHSCLLHKVLGSGRGSDVSEGDEDLPLSFPRHASPSRFCLPWEAASSRAVAPAVRTPGGK